MRDEDKTREALLDELKELRLKKTGLQGRKTGDKQAEEIARHPHDTLPKKVINASNVTFADLFDLDDIQKIQDSFARATGVASLITTPNGQPITKPSNIVVKGEVRGTVDVFYMEEKPELDEGPFLKEERSLIDGLARNLSEVSERQEAENEVRKHLDRPRT